MTPIIILSTPSDISTTNVIRWIHYLDNNIQVIRLHPDDLYNANICQTGIEGNIIIKFDDKEISTDNIGAIWTRKLGNPSLLQSKKSKKIGSALSVLNKNIIAEFQTFFSYFIYKITTNKNVYWFNQPFYSTPNKLQQLEFAKEVGLEVPFTLLRTCLSSNDIQKNLITKHLSETVSFSSYQNRYCSYTSQITNQDLNENFFVSFFQENIEKELELRVLYINGKCYTMAILSQQNIQTQTDFRHYDYDNENRIETFQLPQEIIEKISLLMNKLNLQTGSLDFILDKKGNYVFLEVNPSGQYDIFNHYSSLMPDKLIAEHLIKKINEIRF